MLTETQSDFCAFRKIKLGNSYMLPRFGFTIYDRPSYIGKSEFINTNPFTKSLDHALIIPIEQIDEFYKIRFETGSNNTFFYMLKSDLEFRGVFLALFLRAVLWPIFSFYNFLRNEV